MEKGKTMTLHTMSFEMTPLAAGDKEIEITGGEGDEHVRILIDYDDMTEEQAAFIRDKIAPAIEALPSLLQVIMTAEMTFRQYAMEHTQKAGDTNDPAEASARMAKAQANLEKANLMKAALRTAGAA